jgi:hypothetical protein
MTVRMDEQHDAMSAYERVSTKYRDALDRFGSV